MSTTTDIEQIRSTVMEHIQHHELLGSMTLTERINLSGRIATDVVARRGGSIADALTVLETLGTVKGSSLRGIVRLADIGLPYLNAHHLLYFCAQMGVSVEFGREWLQSFEVPLHDDDEIEGVIIMVHDLIKWIRRTERDPAQREINRARDNTSFLGEIRELSVRKNAPTLESLCDCLGV